MIEIPLEAIPNQSFSIDLDGLRYDLTIKAIDDQAMTMTVVRDGVTIVENAHCQAGELVIRYPYLQQGDFMFYTGDEALPYYTDFGNTCGLVFFTAAELAENVGT